jgi:adenylate cyclase class IV
MAGRKLTDEKRKLRVDLVESLGEFVKRNRDVYEEEEIAELVTQVKRIAKFLGVVPTEE